MINVNAWLALSCWESWNNGLFDNESVTRSTLIFPMAITACDAVAAVGNNTHNIEQITTLRSLVSVQKLIKIEINLKVIIYCLKQYNLNLIWLYN